MNVEALLIRLEETHVNPRAQAALLRDIEAITHHPTLVAIGSKCCTVGLDHCAKSAASYSNVLATSVLTKQPKLVEAWMRDATTGLSLLYVVAKPGVLDRETAQRCLNEAAITRLVSLFVSADADHAVLQLFPRLTASLHKLYGTFPPLRAIIRDTLLERLDAAVDEVPSFHCPAVLRALEPLLAGLRAPLGNDHHYIIRSHLAGVCRAHHEVDDILCAMQLYQPALSPCLVAVVSKLADNDTSELLTWYIRDVILANWTKSDSHYNIGVLRTLNSLVPFVDGQTFTAVLHDLLEILSACIAGENASLAIEGGATVCAHQFVQLTARDAKTTATVLSAVLPALLRDLKVHWDTATVCRTAEAFDGFIDQFGAETVDRLCVDYLRNHRGTDKAEAEALYRKYISELNNVREKESQQVADLHREMEERRGAGRSILPEAVKSHLNFVFGNELGRGAYSVVKYAKLIEREVNQKLWTSFAVKIISKSLLVEDLDCAEEMVKEVEVHKKLDHPGILKLNGCVEDAKSIFVVLEHCEKGDLFDAVLKSESASLPSLEWVRHCVAELILALNYIHATHRYIYADLKPENVLLADDGHIRLCDFGSMLALDSVFPTCQQRFSTTAEYTAPEIVDPARDQEKVTTAVDWWALGCFTYQLLTGLLPLCGTNDEETLELVATCNSDGRFPESLFDDFGEDKIPAAMRQFVCDCLQWDTPERLDYTSAVIHPLFQPRALNSTDQGLDVRSAFTTAPAALKLTSKINRAEYTDTKYQSRRKQSMLWTHMGGAATEKKKSSGTSSDGGRPAALLVEEDDSNKTWGSFLPVVVRSANDDEDQQVMNQVVGGGVPVPSKVRPAMVDPRVAAVQQEVKARQMRRKDYQGKTASAGGSSSEKPLDWYVTTMPQRP